MLMICLRYETCIAATARIINDHCGRAAGNDAATLDDLRVEEGELERPLELFILELADALIRGSRSCEARA